MERRDLEPCKLPAWAGRSRVGFVLGADPTVENFVVALAAADTEPSP